MTPQQIKDDAPEGATHYADQYGVEYFKLKRKIIYIYDDGWHLLVKEQWGFIRPLIKPLN